MQLSTTEELRNAPIKLGVRQVSKDLEYRIVGELGMLEVIRQHGLEHCNEAIKYSNYESYKSWFYCKYTGKFVSILNEIDWMILKRNFTPHY